MKKEFSQHCYRTSTTLIKYVEIRDAKELLWAFVIVFSYCEEELALENVVFQVMRSAYQ